MWCSHVALSLRHGALLSLVERLRAVPTIIIVDDSEDARGQDIRACFFQNGWRPLKQ
ncbi:MAG: hypothetical protein HYR63_21485 [Proteobacteria bacterium]|nr:hypothetical protein [Pseudomonadota bacterium]MBI3500128.1 hypothetical protein [Pseudomonadota bacterium]